MKIDWKDEIIGARIDKQPHVISVYLNKIKLKQSADESAIAINNK